jgi:hypothetical protein
MPLAGKAAQNLPLAILCGFACHRNRISARSRSSRVLGKNIRYN